MTEYKVGDKVRMVTERPDRWNHGGRMDEFLGAVLTIDAIDETFVSFKAYDTKQWVFRITDIAGFAEPQPFLKGAGRAVDGKKYLVVNNEDSDFPEGSIVMAMSSDRFYPDADGVYSYV